MSETNSGEELMGKRYRDHRGPPSDDSEDSYDNFEECADDLEYKAKCKRITKRNRQAAIAEQNAANASRKKPLKE